MGWYRKPKLLKWVAVLDSATADFVQTVDYIMEIFLIVKRKDIARTEVKNDAGEVTQKGSYIAKDTILEIYDEMQHAIDTGQPYQTKLDPPPGPLEEWRVKAGRMANGEWKMAPTRTPLAIRHSPFATKPRRTTNPSGLVIFICRKRRIPLAQSIQETTVVSNFQLGKPPIVESWIAFDFEPNPDKVEWDGRLADELAGVLADRFPKKEFVFQSEIRVIQPAKHQPPVPQSIETKVTTVRIRNEEETRIFQLADDRIAVNQLKGPDG